MLAKLVEDLHAEALELALRLKACQEKTLPEFRRTHDPIVNLHLFHYEQMLVNCMIEASSWLIAQQDVLSGEKRSRDTVSTAPFAIPEEAEFATPFLQRFPPALVALGESILALHRRIVRVGDKVEIALGDLVERGRPTHPATLPAYQKFNAFLSHENIIIG